MNVVLAFSLSQLIAKSLIIICWHALGFALSSAENFVLKRLNSIMLERFNFIDANFEFK
jgi:hypothetical protein